MAAWDDVGRTAVYFYDAGEDPRPALVISDDGATLTLVTVSYDGSIVVRSGVTPASNPANPAPGECVIKELIASQIAALTAAALSPGVQVAFWFEIADAASANYDKVIALGDSTRNLMVTDVVVTKRAGNGGAGDTVTVQSGATAITDAIDTNINDKAIARPATIDDASATVPHGGTLRVAVNNGGSGNAAVRVIVSGVIV